MGKIDRQDNVTNVPSLNALLKSSDYHFIMLFKNNKVTKELMVEYLDPTTDKNFKLACIDKAIDFLQIMKKKISGQSIDQLMKKSKASEVTLQEMLGSHKIKMPLDESSIKHAIEILHEYFKSIKHEIKIIASVNNIIIKVKSDSPERNQAFDDFKKKFWNRYYNEVLKPSLGEFTISIEIE